jgi:phenylacetate-CoA ligase
MADSRDIWLDTLEYFRRDADRPANDKYWSSLDTVSRDELRAIHDQKLSAVVRYVYDYIPFYRRKFDRITLRPEDIRSVDDLHLIPITTKAEMADDVSQNPPWGTFTAVDDEAWRQRGWQAFATSGTTGQPRLFRYTELDRSLWAWGNARAMWAMGFRPGRDSALLAFGYGPHVWLWGVHYALNLMRIPIVTAGGLDTRTRARYIDQYKPTILACSPSYALYLASVMREMGIDPETSSVRRLFCAGEPGFSVPGTRRRLEETWKADLHEFYGCTEAAPAAGGYTCTEVVAHKKGPPSTHLMADTHIWETVAPDTLQPVQRGQRGLSVVTNLFSEASPQLRFLVGDFTTLDSRRCECGRTQGRAAGGFLGRADDMLSIRGITLFPSAIEDAVRRVGELAEEFQIVVSSDRDLDVLTVKVEPRPGVSAGRHQTLVKLVETEIISRCEVRPNIEMVPAGTLPKTEFKAKRVQDLR